jgi:hypothetical protein
MILTGHAGGWRGTIRRMRTPPVMTAALLAAMLAIPAGAHSAPVRAATKTVVAKGVAHPVLPWIEDDLNRSLAEAKARKLPIFVESWAPW